MLSCDIFYVSFLWLVIRHILTVEGKHSAFVSKANYKSVNYNIFCIIYELESIVSYMHSCRGKSIEGKSQCFSDGVRIGALTFYIYSIYIIKR